MSSDEVGELQISLARIEEKIDAFKENSHDHETRIRWLERLTYIALGAGVVSGGAGGALASTLMGR